MITTINIPTGATYSIEDFAMIYSTSVRSILDTRNTLRGNPFNIRGKSYFIGKNKLIDIKDNFGTANGLFFQFAYTLPEFHFYITYATASQTNIGGSIDYLLTDNGSIVYNILRNGVRYTGDNEENSLQNYNGMMNRGFRSMAINDSVTNAISRFHTRNFFNFPNDTPIGFYIGKTFFNSLIDIINSNNNYFGLYFSFAMETNKLYLVVTQAILNSVNNRVEEDFNLGFYLSNKPITGGTTPPNGAPQVPST